MLGSEQKLGLQVTSVIAFIPSLFSKVTNAKFRRCRGNRCNRCNRPVTRSAIIGT